MNPEILRSLAALQGMQLRFNSSASEMYAMIGRDEPVRTLRHVVMPCGNNEFSVVDRQTDQTQAVCTGIDKAVRFAKRRDEAPVAVEQTPTARPPADFATWMLTWTAIFCVIIAVFAFYGSHP